MNRLEIERDRRRINYLVTKYDDLNGKYEIMSHWTKYLCVLISGYLEKSIQRTLKDYTKNKSHPNINRYVEINLNKFQNAKCSNIIELIALYNLDWASEMKRYSDGEIKESIDGIVNTRHQVAHGEDIQLTPSNLIKYYSNINKFIDHFWDYVHA